jgi:hypothetical protein
MPRITSLTRLVGMGTFPATRAAALKAVRTGQLRELGHRAMRDRMGLARQLANPVYAREHALAAVLHPATKELAAATLFFLPTRFLPVSWAITRLSRPLVRRLERASR